MDKNEIYSKLENQYFGPEMHEKEEIEQLPKLLNGVRIFVDVGSSLGQYTYFANQILSNAEIYCIEPDPFKVKRLRELAKEWEAMGSNRIHVIPKALSDAPGTLRFFVPATHETSGAFFPVYKGEWKEIEVEVDTLDNLFCDLHVDFIKIDVEGAELRVLRGGINILQKQNVRIFLEIAPWGDLERRYRPSDIFKFMAKQGYSFSVIGTHFLFSRSQNRFLTTLKAYGAGSVADRPWLRKAVRQLLFLGKRIFTWI